MIMKSRTNILNSHCTIFDGIKLDNDQECTICFDIYLSDKIDSGWDNIVLNGIFTTMS